MLPLPPPTALPHQALVERLKDYGQEDVFALWNELSPEERDLLLSDIEAGEPLYVLLCCWVAAVGAGLLKSEEILEGVTRVSISNDLEFEEQNFIVLMTEARQRRAKLNIDAPTIPMELRVEKALEGIYACCFRRGLIEDEDEKLLQVMLTSVFPSVEKSEIERIIKEKATRVAEGGEEENVMAKRLPKEVIQMQMKDLEFLQQQNIES